MANTCKYEKWKRYVSYDGGVTWDFLDDVKGELIEHDSPDCTIPEEQYRWVDSGYTCVDYDKYQQQIKQVSYDSGSTWSNVVPNEFSATTLIESNSSYCGYVPPTPTGTKWIATYAGGTTSSAECSNSSVISRNDISLTNLVSVQVGDCVTEIGSAMCSGCTSLTSFTIPNSVTEIKYGTFNSCKSLSSIAIPNRVTSIGNWAFNDCFSLTSIIIPNSVTTIGEWAFSRCSGSTSVTIGSGVTSIKRHAFTACRSLTSITIPSGVTSISNGAFSYCSGLTSVTVEATTPPALDGERWFYETNNCPIYVLAESLDAYKSAPNWSEYADRIQPIT